MTLRDGTNTTRAAPYTWGDYQSWPDDAAWELIGGKAFAMSPSPTPRHQWVLVQLAARLTEFFEGTDCQPFPAPLDVKLSDADVVQPDLMVVCDPTQIRPTHIEGPPKLVIEILSQSSIVHDRVRKLHLYAHFGVTEYWLIQPAPGVVEVLTLTPDTGCRVHDTYAAQDTLTSPTFPGLEIPLAPIFSFPAAADHAAGIQIREASPPYGS